MRLRLVSLITICAVPRWFYDRFVITGERQKRAVLHARAMGERVDRESVRELMARLDDVQSTFVCKSEVYFVRLIAFIARLIVSMKFCSRRAKKNA